jgi:hypothetical protein
MEYNICYVQKHDAHKSAYKNSKINGEAIWWC